MHALRAGYKCRPIAFRRAHVSAANLGQGHAILQNRRREITRRKARALLYGKARRFRSSEHIIRAFHPARQPSADAHLLMGTRQKRIEARYAERSGLAPFRFASYLRGRSFDHPTGCL
jgi:hypothetical protein